MAYVRYITDITINEDDPSLIDLELTPKAGVGLRISSCPPEYKVTATPEECNGNVLYTWPSSSPTATNTYSTSSIYDVTVVAECDNPDQTISKSISLDNCA